MSYPGLTVLIFSRNDVLAALEIVQELHDFADQVVIIDSSDNKNHKKLLDEKGRCGFSKLDIFRAVALGYVEPLREFGLTKCKYDWVLYLDTDERVSKDLRVALKEFISGSEFSAFQLSRVDLIENSKKGSKITHGGRQTRLFNRHCISYAGKIHEQPKISGRISKPEKKYCIYHCMVDRYDRRKLIRYFAIESMTNRLRYVDLSSTVGNPLFSHILTNYAKISRKKEVHELTKNDYSFLYLMKSLQATLEMIRCSSIYPSEIFGAMKYNLMYSYDKCNYFFVTSKEDAFIFLKISAEIRAFGGLIKYLLLDNDYVVKHITDKLGEKDNPLNNLRIVLLARHNKGVTYYADL